MDISKLQKQCDALLLSLLGSNELAEEWWESPNKGFDGQKPIDVDLIEVRKYLLGHAFGGW